MVITQPVAIRHELHKRLITDQNKESPSHTPILPEPAPERENQTGKATLPSGACERGGAGRIDHRCELPVS
jgi:hypothetical protein